MADINFFINTAGFTYDLNTSGSGLAFFGDSGFGDAIPVGQYNGTTFVSDGLGVTQGAQGKNIKWLKDKVIGGGAAQVGSGIISGPVEKPLQDIPNYQSTLQVRFTHTSAVRTQNAELRIYNRSDINEAAVGVTTKVAEIIHPSQTAGPTGSGDDDWFTPAGSAVVVEFCDSPGPSGIYGGTTRDLGQGGNWYQHDWHAAISASPDSIGNKTAYGLYFALEYL